MKFFNVIWFFKFIYWFERDNKRETVRDIDFCLLLHPSVYLLVDSCMCLDWGLNLQPCHIRMMLWPTELPSHGHCVFGNKVLLEYRQIYSHVVNDCFHTTATELSLTETTWSTKPEISGSRRKNLPTHAIEEPNFKLYLDINFLEPQLKAPSPLPTPQ